MTMRAATLLSILSIGCVDNTLTASSAAMETKAHVVTGSPEISVAPTTIDYGRVIPGNRVEQPFHVENHGTSELWVDAIYLELDGVFDLVLLDPLPWELEPGEGRVVIAGFTPEHEGTYEGWAWVESNDDDEAAVAVELFNEPWISNDEDGPRSNDEPEPDPEFEEPEPEEDEPTEEPAPDPSYPPEGDTPASRIFDCPDTATATMDGDELVALSWDQTEDSGVITATSAGWYHIYDVAFSESGTSQWNETAYVQISNGTNPSGEPVWGNCGADWILPDQDNIETPDPATRYYVGTFWLDAGANTATVLHYCPLYRAGVCTEFHASSNWNTTCDRPDANSVHFTGEGLCVKAAD